MKLFESAISSFLSAFFAPFAAMKRHFSLNGNGKPDKNSIFGAWLPPCYAVLSGVIACVWMTASPGLAQSSRPLPIFPQAAKAGPNASERKRANGLYQLARRENRSLRWNGCLATQAFMRAKRMSSEGYFEHRDPRTGRNPVWKSVSICVNAESPGARASAAENLAKGAETPEVIHKALMASPTHRKNILDRRFNRMGVGCYDEICVELFAGF